MPRTTKRSIANVLFQTRMKLPRLHLVFLGPPCKRVLLLRLQQLIAEHLAATAARHVQCIHAEGPCVLVLHVNHQGRSRPSPSITPLAFGSYGLPSSPKAATARLPWSWDVSASRRGITSR